MSRTYRSLKGEQPNNFWLSPLWSGDDYQEAEAELKERQAKFHRDGSWVYVRGRYGKAHDRDRGLRSKVRDEIKRVVMTEFRDDYSPDPEMVLRSHGKWHMY